MEFSTKDPWDILRTNGLAFRFQNHDKATDLANLTRHAALSEGMCLRLQLLIMFIYLSEASVPAHTAQVRCYRCCRMRIREREEFRS